MLQRFLGVLVFLAISLWKATLGITIVGEEHASGHPREGEEAARADLAPADGGRDPRPPRRGLRDDGVEERGRRDHRDVPASAGASSRGARLVLAGRRGDRSFLAALKAAPGGARRPTGLAGQRGRASAASSSSPRKERPRPAVLVLLLQRALPELVGPLPPPLPFSRCVVVLRGRPRARGGGGRGTPIPRRAGAAIDADGRSRPSLGVVDAPREKGEEGMTLPVSLAERRGRPRADRGPRPPHARPDVFESRRASAPDLLQVRDVQRVGAFKARGAFRASRSDGRRAPARRRRVLVGNHAQAVALAARTLRISRDDRDAATRAGDEARGDARVRRGREGLRPGGGEPRSDREGSSSARAASSCRRSTIPP